MDENYALPDVSVLAAVAVGEPGKRTFFVSMGQSGQWYRLWLEKEELLALAMAIRQFLFVLSQSESGPRVSPLTEASSGDAPTGMPSAELELEELTLGYEDEKAVLDIVAHRSGPKSADKVTLRAALRLGQLRDLGNQADRVCAAGRPRCPICGQPIDPTGHDCPGSN